MNLVTLKSAVASATLVVGLLSASLASAATVGVMTGSPLTAAASETGSTNNDKLNVGDDKELQVNLDTIFGISDWVYLGKYEFDDTGEKTSNIMLSSFNTKMGSFSISDAIFNAYTNFILVLKGSADENYIAYNLESEDGTYSSPFTNKKGKMQDISHISLYGSGDTGDVDGPSPVPLPAGLPMLLSAVAGMAYLRKRKQKA